MDNLGTIPLPYLSVKVLTGYEPHALTRFSKSFHVSLHIKSTLSNMPRVTSTKWDRTLVLNIPIFIAIWLGLRAALEIHFCLLIGHQILAYWLNTYHLEITGYSDDPWWREFYIDFEFSRLQFRSHPIGPTGSSSLGPDGDNPPPHGDHADHLPDLAEGRPPTPPQQPSSSSEMDNIHVVINQNRHTPEPVPPPRYYVSQHLNLLGSNPTIASGSRPEECRISK